LTDGDVFVNLCSSSSFLLPAVLDIVLIVDTRIFVRFQRGVQLSRTCVRIVLFLHRIEDLTWSFELLLWSLSIAAWTSPLASGGLDESRLDAVHVVGTWTGSAVDQVCSFRSSTNQAVTLSRGLVDTFITIPITLGNLGDGRFEAVCMVSLITAIAQQQSILILSSVTELTGGLHDRLVPGNGSF